MLEGVDEMSSSGRKRQLPLHDSLENDTKFSIPSRWQQLLYLLGRPRGSGNPLLSHYASYSLDMENSTEPTADEKAAQIAAIFLRDYEHSRAPTFPTCHPGEINKDVLALHAVRFSELWKTIRVVAVLVLLGATGLESTSVWLATFLHTVAFLIFGLDMRMRILIGIPPESLQNAMLCFMGASFLESMYLLMTGRSCLFFWTSIVKPIAVFYASTKASRALMSLARIVPVITRVLALELLLIFAFAAVSSCIFADQADSFGSLWQSWLSLFQRKSLHCHHVCSTTTAKPR